MKAVNPLCLRLVNRPLHDIRRRLLLVRKWCRLPPGALDSRISLCLHYLWIRLFIYKHHASLVTNRPRKSLGYRLGCVVSNCTLPLSKTLLTQSLPGLSRDIRTRSSYRKDKNKSCSLFILGNFLFAIHLVFIHLSTCCLHCHCVAGSVRTRSSDSRHSPFHTTTTTIHFVVPQNNTGWLSSCLNSLPFY